VSGVYEEPGGSPFAQRGVSMSSVPRVAIVLVNWNGRKDLLECLETVFRLEYPDYYVVVCDNASSDGSVDALLAWRTDAEPVKCESPEFDRLLTTPFDRSAIPLVHLRNGGPCRAPISRGTLVLIETGANLGFAGGNNVGIRNAFAVGEADFVWLLNTDTVVQPDALNQLVTRASLEDCPGIVGSSLVYYWKPDTVQAMGGARLDARTLRTPHIGIGKSIASIPDDPRTVERDMAYVVGASMLVSRNFIKTVGLMCEDYFLYFEEIDWAMRSNGLFGLAYAPASVVYHKVGGSSARTVSSTALRYLYANRLKFVARFLPASFFRALCVACIDAIKLALKGQLRAALVIVKAVLGAPRLYREGRIVENPIV
jgi:GT2 family glycosyltransferase